jgi:glycosyltransferase involved in cell wall biosynthesis
MCRQLSAAGAEALIASTDANGAGDLGLSLEGEIAYEGARVILFHRQWGESFKYSRPLARWLRQAVAKFDVVHIHSVFGHACLSAGVACRDAGVPYVVRPLGTLDSWSLSQKPLRKRIALALGARRLLTGAAAVHYTSVREKAGSESGVGLSRGVVIPLGVDEEFFRAVPAAGEFRERFKELENDPFLLVVSRLHPKKNLIEFVRHFMDAVGAAALSRWRLVIAGDGDPEYVRELAASIARHPAGRRVHLVGWIAGALKAAGYREAELVALPSLQENFGLSIVEAMACGTPSLVSSEVDLSEEIVAAGAGWAAPARGLELRATLERILADPALRRDAGAAARVLAAERFRWSAVVVALTSLYRSILMSRGSSK